MNEHSHLVGQLAIPVSFCCLELGSEFFEYSTKVLSIFNAGFVITSPRKLRTGTVLSLRIRVPSDKIKGTFWETRCIGRVVLEQKFKDGGVGYKVEMENSLPD
jgi:hypothetical protein